MRSRALSYRKEEGMRRTSVVLVAFAVVMGLTTTVLANGPVERETEDVTGAQFVCDDAVYTITSGEIRVFFHGVSAAQGNQSGIFRIRPVKVVAEDESGNPVSIVGTFSEGEALNANTGGGVFTLTAKFQLVSKGGGTVGNVNVTFHVTAQANNLVIKEFAIGNCSLPE
jgi:hypothetical protein